MPFNRAVVFVLGPIITIAAGLVCGLGARYGFAWKQDDVASDLATAAVVVTPMILSHLKLQKWLDGWQAYEKRLDSASMRSFGAELKNSIGHINVNTATDAPASDVQVGPPPIAVPGAFEGANEPRA